MREAGIRILANEISDMCTLSIGNSKSRYTNKVQTTNSHNKTKSFIILCYLHFSILVYIFQYLYTNSYSFDLTEEGEEII